MAKERGGRKNVKNAVLRLVRAVEGSREFLEWRKGYRSGGGGFGRTESYERAETGSSGTAAGDKTATQTQQAQSSEEQVEARIRQIIEEKHRQQVTREPQKPASLREDPNAQKFVRDMMKDKPFR